MRLGWAALFDTACGYGVPPADARRLSNLLLSAALTLGGAEPSVISRQVRELMREPHFVIRLRSREWLSLVQIAANAATSSQKEGVDFDGWVESFQKADPSRKNLGAYATPRGFAEALAIAVMPPRSRTANAHVVDPACGAGALLIACLNRLYPEPCAAKRKAALRLFGMELDPAARELACLLVWIAAGAHHGDLPKISSNIRCGNALLHPWWDERAYDVLVMNPPWESLRHKAADASHAKERDATIARIEEQQAAASNLPKLYSAQGTGDRNLCKAFIELAPHLLKDGGRIAALIPAAFTSDEGMSELRRLYLEQFSLESWTGFENRAKAFDIDSRYKFGIIVGKRSKGGTQTLGLRAFATDPDEMTAPHVIVDRRQLESIGGPVGIIPDITSRRELDVLTTMLTEGTPFFDDGEFGLVHYKREVDLTLGKQRGSFSRLGERNALWNNDATIRLGSKGTFVPVLEGRMVGGYDYFQKSWVKGEGRTAVWRENGDDPLDSCRPQYVARPKEGAEFRLAICDVTSATNTRTVHATLVPDGWICGNTAPVLRFGTEKAMFAGLAVLNSLTFDWLARRMVSGLHLNKFYLSCMAWPKLSSSDVAKLADAGRSLAALGPRRPIGVQRVDTASIVELRSSIEATVARGFGLGPTDLTFMFAEDVNDRRGFWRYYSAVPDSLKVVRDVTRSIG